MTTSSARSIADVSEGTILATVDIMVPPERVFHALSDGNEIARWWGAPGAYTTDRWTTDFRVGGKWRADGRGADGAPFFVEGEFLEIDPPWRIVQTWSPSWTAGPPTTLRYQLSAIAGGTRLVVRHEGFKGRPESCETHSIGWIRVLEWLAADIGPKPMPDTAKYFVARLLGPRPDFARTLSAEELAMMQAHVRYWLPVMESGKVLALGPVDDPNWTYGIGIMRVDSEEELLELQRNDPAIVLGKGGTRYENAPMLRIAYPNR
jgi:uncharacterized protein YndB with AHSA1/START domain